MTLLAYSSYRCCQEFAVCRKMRSMAIHAIILSRFMLFFTPHFFLEIPMACVAKVVALGQQQVFQFGLVGAVAFSTGSFNEGAMLRF